MVCFTTADQSSKVLKTMFDTKKHMDVSFLAGPDKKIVKAHRSVLTAALEDFDLIFSESFKENDDSTIVLDEIASETIESIVKFVYCGVIEIPDMDTAFQLWEPVHTVKIESLQDHVLEYIKNNITIKNCLGVYLLAKKYEEEDLAALSMEFAVSNIEKVIEKDEFLHLAKDHLIKYIKAAKEKDALEDIIGRAALTWLNFKEQRQEHFKEILFLLDIEKIDDPSLIDDLESMCTDIEDVKYILKAFRKRSFNNRRPVHPMNRSPVDRIVFIQNNGRNKTISEFDVTSNLILGEENVDLNGFVLGTWNGTLIILQYNRLKITSYNMKTKASTDVGVYNFINYLDSTILDNELYIVTVGHCYIIDLISGRLLKTLDCPPTYEFKGVTSCKKAIYFIVLMRNQNYNRPYNHNHQYGYQQYQQYGFGVAQYLSDTKMIKIVGALKNSQYWFRKCIGHNDFIFIFTEHTSHVFDLIKKEWKPDQTIHISSMYDAVSTKNKLIVLQDNALCEINSNYQVIKFKNPFRSLKHDCKMFSFVMSSSSII